jgi:MFS family permease
MLKPPKSPMGPLVVMGLSIVLVLYVHTSLAPAFPEMVEFFDSDYSVISWVLTAYMVSGAAVTIVIGRLADMYGPKKMLLLVFMCYTVGVVLAPFTQDIYVLLSLRALQGVAVAVVPIATRIARDIFPPEKFPMAQGTILSMYQGGAIGPVIAGVFISLYVAEVPTDDGGTTTVPNDMAFSVISLVGAICSLLIIAFMAIMRRRALKMGMPANK